MLLTFMHLADDFNKKLLRKEEQNMFQELCLPSNIPTFCETSCLELKPNSHELSWTFLYAKVITLVIWSIQMLN